MGYAGKVQNLKIEDITKFLKNAPSFYEATYSPESKYYPTILEQEYRQNVDGKTGNLLEQSEQIEPIKQTVDMQVLSWNLVENHDCAINSIPENFKEGYYELLVPNQKSYFLSSRDLMFNNNDDASFNVLQVTNSYVAINVPFGTSTRHISFGERNAAVRPVITLKSNVQIDTEKSGDGTEVGKEYILK